MMTTRLPVKRSKFRAPRGSLLRPERLVLSPPQKLCNWLARLAAVYLLFLVADAGHAAGEPFVAPTLNPELAIHQYARRSWWFDDGLPSNRVLDIIQTRRGYLWVATDQ